jgi:hypothetical protein
VFAEALQAIKHILDSNNQPFFLTCGTLLAAYRDKKFIDSDIDIDIGIMYSNFNPRIIQWIRDSVIFTVSNQRGIYKEAYKFFAIYNKSIIIDISIHYSLQKENDADLYWYGTHGCAEHKKEGYFIWANHYRGFKKILFLGYEYDIPENTEEVLEENYGKSWRTPKSFDYISGLKNGEFKNIIN